MLAYAVADALVSWRALQGKAEAVPTAGDKR